MMLGEAIEPERVLSYVDALDDLTEKQLEFGFDQAGRLFKPEFGRTFPVPAELREWAEQWRPEPAREGSMADTYKHLRGKLAQEAWAAIEDHGRPQEYISGEARQDYATRIIAEMRAQITSGAYDMPKSPISEESYRAAAERLAAQRNGPSTIPEDPAKRRSWAREKAKNMGWLVEREAGDEAE